MTVDMNVVNLTLGIVGTIAGVVSLTVHVWRLKRESPRLTINVLSCEHGYQHETKTLSFWGEIELRNLGDRGTNILGIDVKFNDDKKEYTLKTSDQEKVIDRDLVRWIRPHETIRTTQTAFTKFENKPQSHIECIFTVYHTHGAEKIKAKSQKINKPHE